MRFGEKTWEQVALRSQNVRPGSVEWNWQCVVAPISKNERPGVERTWECVVATIITHGAEGGGGGGVVLYLLSYFSIIIPIQS